MRFFPARKITAAFVVTVYTAMNVVLASAAEVNFWSERKRQMAALPSPLSSQLPSITSTLPSAQKTSLTAKELQKWSSPLQALLAAVPLTYGTVQDIYDPASLKDSYAGQVRAPILLLQDIHLNTEAQLNMARVLTSLIEQKQVGLVGVEGAFDRFQFERVRGSADAKKAKQVATEFLNQNRIAAPVYAGLTTAGKLPPFIGVDDKIHYTANVQGYLDSKEVKPAALREMQERRQALDVQAAGAFSPELKQFDALRRSYHVGTIDLGPYVEKLQVYSPRSIDHSPVLRKFLEAYLLEKSLDFNRVNAERQRIIETLARKLNAAEMSDLMNQSLAYKLGRTSFSAYYSSLKDLCQAKGVSLQSAPAFDEYIRYVLVSDGIKADKLFAAISDLEKTLAEKLARTPEEKRWAEESVHLDLTAKLLEFSLTPEEWKEYQALRISDFGLRNKRLLMPFEEFYREADFRSQKMVANLLSFNPKSAIRNSQCLVSGGFHTSEITQLLRDQKIPYVVVTPKITKIDTASGSAYLSVFDRQKTPLSKLFNGQKLFVNPVSVGAVTTIDKIDRKDPAGLIPEIKKAADTTQEVSEALGGSYEAPRFSVYAAPNWGALAMIFPILGLIVGSTLSAGSALHNVIYGLLGFSIGLIAIRTVRPYRGSDLLINGLFLFYALSALVPEDVVGANNSHWQNFIRNNWLGFFNHLSIGGLFLWGLFIGNRQVNQRIRAHKETGAAVDSPFFFNSSPVASRFFLLMVPLLDLAINAVSIHFPASVFFHSASFSAAYILGFYACWIVLALVSYRFKLPVGLLIIISGLIGNITEGALWNGIFDPFAVFSNRPNIGDIFFMLGVGILGADLMVARNLHRNGISVDYAVAAESNEGRPRWRKYLLSGIYFGILLGISSLWAVLPGPRAPPGLSKAGVRYASILGGNLHFIAEDPTLFRRYVEWTIRLSVYNYPENYSSAEYQESLELWRPLVMQYPKETLAALQKLYGADAVFRRPPVILNQTHLVRSIKDTETENSYLVVLLMRKAVNAHLALQSDTTDLKKYPAGDGFKIMGDHGVGNLPFLMEATEAALERRWKLYPEVREADLKNGFNAELVKLWTTYRETRRYRPWYNDKISEWNVKYGEARAQLPQEQKEMRGALAAGGLLPWMHQALFWWMSWETYKTWAFVLENGVFGLFIGLPMGLLLHNTFGVEIVESIQWAGAVTWTSFFLAHFHRSARDNLGYAGVIAGANIISTFLFAPLFPQDPLSYLVFINAVGLLTHFIANLFGQGWRMGFEPILIPISETVVNGDGTISRGQKWAQLPILKRPVLLMMGEPEERVPRTSPADFFRENFSTVRERGAFVFDLDETLAEVDVPVSVEMLEMLMRLLEMDIPVVIVTSNTEPSVMSRAFEPLKEMAARRGSTAALANLVIYANAGGTKVTVSKTGELIPNEAYNAEHASAVPLDNIKQSVEDLARRRFFLSPEEEGAWRQWIKKGFPDSAVDNSWMEGNDKWECLVLTTEELTQRSRNKGNITQPVLEVRGARSDGSYAAVALRFTPSTIAERSRYQEEVLAAAGTGLLRSYSGGRSTSEFVAPNASKQAVIRDLINNGVNGRTLDPTHVAYFDDGFRKGMPAEDIFEDPIIKASGLWTFSCARSASEESLAKHWIGYGPPAVQEFIGNVLADSAAASSPGDPQDPEREKWKGFFGGTYKEFLVKNYEQLSFDDALRNRLLTEAAALDPEFGRLMRRYVEFLVHPDSEREQFHDLMSEINRVLRPRKFMCTDNMANNPPLVRRSGFLFFDVSGEKKISIRDKQTEEVFEKTIFLLRDLTDTNYPEHSNAAAYNRMDDVGYVILESLSLTSAATLNFLLLDEQKVSNYLLNFRPQFSLRDYQFLIDRFFHLISVVDWHFLGTFKDKYDRLNDAASRFAQDFPLLSWLTADEFPLSYAAKWVIRDRVKETGNPDLLERWDEIIRIENDLQSDITRLKGVVEKTRAAVDAPINQLYKDILWREVRKKFSSTQINEATKYARSVRAKEAVRHLVGDIRGYETLQGREFPLAADARVTAEVVDQLIELNAIRGNPIENFSEELRARFQDWKEGESVSPRAYRDMLNYLMAQDAQEAAGHEFFHAFMDDRAVNKTLPRGPGGNHPRISTTVTDDERVTALAEVAFFSAWPHLKAARYLTKTISYRYSPHTAGYHQIMNVVTGKFDLPYDQTNSPQVVLQALEGISSSPLGAAGFFADLMLDSKLVAPGLRMDPRHWEVTLEPITEEEMGRVDLSLTAFGGLLPWMYQALFRWMSWETYKSWAFGLENLVFGVFIGIPFGLILHFGLGVDIMQSIQWASAVSWSSFFLAHFHHSARDNLGYAGVIAGANIISTFLFAPLFAQDPLSYLIFLQAVGLLTHFIANLFGRGWRIGFEPILIPVSETVVNGDGTISRGQGWVQLPIIKRPVLFMTGDLTNDEPQKSQPLSEAEEASISGIARFRPLLDEDGWGTEWHAVQQQGAFLTLIRLRDPGVPQYRVNQQAETIEFKFVEGPRMDEWVKNASKTLTPEEFFPQLIEHTITVIETLQRLNKAGIYLTDVNPENIVIDATSNKPVLIDLFDTKATKKVVSAETIRKDIFAWSASHYLLESPQAQARGTAWQAELGKAVEIVGVRQDLSLATLVSDLKQFREERWGSQELRLGRFWNDQVRDDLRAILGINFTVKPVTNTADEFEIEFLHNEKYLFRLGFRKQGLDILIGGTGTAGLKDVLTEDDDRHARVAAVFNYLEGPLEQLGFTGYRSSMVASQTSKSEKFFQSMGFVRDENEFLENIWRRPFGRRSSPDVSDSPAAGGVLYDNYRHLRKSDPRYQNLSWAKYQEKAYYLENAKIYSSWQVYAVALVATVVYARIVGDFSPETLLLAAYRLINIVAWAWFLWLHLVDYQKYKNGTPEGRGPPIGLGNVISAAVIVSINIALLFLPWSSWIPQLNSPYRLAIFFAALSSFGYLAVHAVVNFASWHISQIFLKKISTETLERVKNYLPADEDDLLNPEQLAPVLARAGMRGLEAISPEAGRVLVLSFLEIVKNAAERTKMDLGKISAHVGRDMRSDTLIITVENPGEIQPKDFSYEKLKIMKENLQYLLFLLPGQVHPDAVIPPQWILDRGFQPNMYTVVRRLKEFLPSSIKKLEEKIAKLEGGKALTFDDAVELIFTPFVTSDPEAFEKKVFYGRKISNGLGYGLWNSKAQLKAFGGDIRVQSGWGKTRFTIRIPLTVTSDAAATDKTVDSNHIGFSDRVYLWGVVLCFVAVGLNAVIGSFAFSSPDTSPTVKLLASWSMSAMGAVSVLYEQIVVANGSRKPWREYDWKLIGRRALGIAIFLGFWNSFFVTDGVMRELIGGHLGLGKGPQLLVQLVLQQFFISPFLTDVGTYYLWNRWMKKSTPETIAIESRTGMARFTGLAFLIWTPVHAIGLFELNFGDAGVGFLFYGITGFLWNALMVLIINNKPEALPWAIRWLLRHSQKLQGVLNLVYRRSWFPAYQRSMPWLQIGLSSSWILYRYTLTPPLAILAAIVAVWLWIDRFVVENKREEVRMKNGAVWLANIGIALANQKPGEFYQSISLGVGNIGKPRFNSDAEMVGQLELWIDNDEFRPAILEALQGRVPAGTDLDELVDVLLAAALAESTDGNGKLQAILANRQVGTRQMFVFQGASSSEREKHARRIALLIALIRAGEDYSNVLVADPAAGPEIFETKLTIEKFGLLSDGSVEVRIDSQFGRHEKEGLIAYLSTTYGETALYVLPASLLKSWNAAPRYIVSFDDLVPVSTVNWELLRQSFRSIMEAA